MWRKASDALALLPGAKEEGWTERFFDERRERPFGAHPGLMIAGPLALGLGALTWYYLEYDVRRYLRIRNM
jgi:hypothetical protein